MSEYIFAVYNAFSESTFGGSAVGIIADAQDLDAEQRQRIAKEIGAPATCFITAVDDIGVDVRFFSTLTEYSMCGHGTIGLMTWLVERGLFQPRNSKTLIVNLRIAGGSVDVEVRSRDDGRVEVMLPLSAATFEPCSVTAVELAELFGIDSTCFDASFPFELTRSDFTHLIVPVSNIATMRKLTPDFATIKSLCHQMKVDTVALFTRETELVESTIHCREFCPAVGTDEAPASGTTNRALACYLLRQGIIDFSTDGHQTVIAEQGYEMGRPSRICTEMTLRDGGIAEIKVGGVATKLMQGMFYVS